MVTESDTWLATCLTCLMTQWKNKMNVGCVVSASTAQILLQLLFPLLSSLPWFVFPSCFSLLLGFFSLYLIHEYVNTIKSLPGHLSFCGSPWCWMIKSGPLLYVLTCILTIFIVKNSLLKSVFVCWNDCCEHTSTTFLLRLHLLSPLTSLVLFCRIKFESISRIWELYLFYVNSPSVCLFPHESFGEVLLWLPPDLLSLYRCMFSLFEILVLFPFSIL